MKNYTSEQLHWANRIFDFLYLKDKIQNADAVIGFGHFDFAIPTYCMDLHNKGLVQHILYTGGIGAGSADFKKPEAIEFLNYSMMINSIVASQIIVEDKSTNTSENIEFLKNIISSKYPSLEFGKGICTIIIVASAYRQRRVNQTCLKLLPNVRTINAPVVTTFEREVELFASKGQDLISFLPGEIERLKKYADLGYIQPCMIPKEIWDASMRLF